MKPIARLAAPVAALALIVLTAACGGSGGPSTSGDNLLENPGAEQNVDGYIGHNGATVSQDTTTASEGKASVKVAIPDASGAGVQVWKADGLTMTPVTAGEPYQFSLDVKGDVGKSVRLEILWHSSEGAFLETSLGPIIFLPLDGFTKTEFSANAPENASLAVPQLVTDAAPGQTVTAWIDNVRFLQTSGSGATPAASPTTPPTP